MVAIPFRETIRLAKIDCQAIFWKHSALRTTPEQQRQGERVFFFPNHREYQQSKESI
jgi:hypothetical protein